MPQSGDMDDNAPVSDSDLDALIERGLARLRESSPASAALLADPARAARVGKVILASDFALETLRRQPDRLHALLGDDGAAPTPAPILAADESGRWQEQLRRYRTAESTRLIWRDVLGLDDVDAILAGSTRLAENCLRIGLEALEAEFAQRHGVVRAADGSVQRLVVFGLGKLGGGELNFSSDVDLVYAFPHNGESDGARSLAAEDYFARLGQRLAKLLDEPTVDGFCHRVDLRLRPFGNAGRVALSFAGMDQYFQREGRDWERYAWLKARAIAGDIEAGERWLESLRPFVYRRYLDYTALDGLREMKAAIAAEVARRELADDIKRGPGGIREIEFLVQALQLIRGGREPSLRERRLMPALRALVATRQVVEGDGAALGQAYRYLRRLENRLQMLRDAQTHALPDNPLDRERIARGLDYPDWPALRVALQRQRDRVAQEFAELLAPRRGQAAPGALEHYWRALPEGGDESVLADAGFTDAATADGALRDFARFSGVRALSDGSRARLDRVVPALLGAAARSAQPDAALKRVLALLQAILRRASYLALLDEQPSALARLVDVLARSALLAERLALYPLLLDELLDARVSGPLPDKQSLHAECNRALDGGDAESTLRELNERRLALSFRIAMAALDRRQPARESTRQLAWLADEVVRVVLRTAEDEVAAAHGRVPQGRFAVIGYGSLGGEELGFGSDLDLVFLYDAPTDAQSDGARPLEAGRWYARLAQKIVGRLSFDQPVASVAPSLHLPGRNELTATVGDVLSHRLGLYRNAFDNKLEEGQDVTFLRGTLASLNSICPPGTCWSYQNIAYDAASEMVARVSGQRYQDAVKRNLFAPIGMTSASLTMDGLTNSPSWARPHSVGRRPLELNDNYYRVPAAGGVGQLLLRPVQLHAGVLRVGLDGLAPLHQLQQVVLQRTAAAAEGGQLVLQVAQLLRGDGTGLQELAVAVLAGADLLDGGAGGDQVDYTKSDAITVNLSTNVNHGGEAEGGSADQH